MMDTVDSGNDLKSKGLWLAPGVAELLRAAMHRRQDEDWESWTPKQRKRARQNGEYYGADRPFKEAS